MSLYSCFYLRTRAGAACFAVVGTIFALTSASTANAWQLPLVVDHVSVVGRLHTTAAAYGRDVGFTARVAGQAVWLFGDTFTPSGLRSATGAWSRRRGDLLTLSEQVDANNAPFQLFPFTSDELAFNNAHSPPPACCQDNSCSSGTDCERKRYALWPAGATTLDARHGLLMYTKYLIHQEFLDYEFMGTGFATVQKSTTQAVRNLNLVFTAADPVSFGAPWRIDAPDGKWMYLWGTSAGMTTILARVPAMKASDRTAYRFWSATAPGCNPAHRALCFVADVTQATDVSQPTDDGLTGGAPGLGMVAWFGWLRRHVSVRQQCVPLSGGGLNCRHAVLRTAPYPEGPWSAPTDVDLNGIIDISGLFIHRELSNPGTIMISGSIADDPETSMREHYLVKVSLRR